MWAALSIDSCVRCRSVRHTKKPKVRIKRTKTSLGYAYRIYLDGAYAGTGLTQASAREGAKRVLANREKAGWRKP